MTAHNESSILSTDFNAKEACDHCLRPVARFSDLVAGEKFRFPGTTISHVRTKSGYRCGYSNGGYSKGVCKTGAKTAVIPLV